MLANLGLKMIMTSLPAAASNSDCRRRSHPDCRATLGTINTNSGAQFEISIDGIPGTYQCVRTPAALAGQKLDDAEKVEPLLRTLPVGLITCHVLTLIMARRP